MLLTRPPLSFSIFPPKGSVEKAPFDLHVLGAPPAFVLSQDQTLRTICISTGLSTSTYLSSIRFPSHLCVGSPNLLTDLPILPDGSISVLLSFAFPPLGGYAESTGSFGSFLSILFNFQGPIPYLLLPSNMAPNALSQASTCFRSVLLFYHCPFVLSTPFCRKLQGPSGQLLYLITCYSYLSTGNFEKYVGGTIKCNKQE